MSFVDVRHFVGQKMNLDVDERLLQPNETREVLNFRFGNFGNQGAGQNLPSTLLVNNTHLSTNGRHKVVGWCDDPERDSLILFICHIPDTGSPEHGRYWYNTTTKLLNKIFVHERLNFQEDHIISANVIGDDVYWNDGYFINYGVDDSSGGGYQDGLNPPRAFNLIKAYNYRTAG